MIVETSSDRQKAKSLAKMASITLERVKDTDIIKYSTNVLIDYYDILRRLMDALAIISGVKATGDGAHKEIIDYVCEYYNLGEGSRIFIQEMRDYRNRISYEGFMITSDYLLKNNTKINNIINNLFEILKIRLKKNE